MTRMTCGFSLYLWYVSFLVCLLPLLPHWPARSSLPFLTSFKLPFSLSLLLFFPPRSSTLPLSFFFFTPSSSLKAPLWPHDPPVQYFTHLSFLMLTPLPPSPSASPPAFLCPETSSLCSAAFLFTSISVWLSFIPSVRLSIPLAARLPGHRLCSLLARFSLGLNVIANVPAWSLQLCVRVTVCVCVCKGVYECVLDSLDSTLLVSLLI